jgi:hypothetical protein
VDGEERRDAAPRLVQPPHDVPGTLGRDHADVDAARRIDLPEVDVEAVGEHQQRALAQVGLDLGVIDRWRRRVRDEHHHDVRPPRSRSGVGDLEASLPRSVRGR